MGSFTIRHGQFFIAAPTSNYGDVDTVQENLLNTLGDSDEIYFEISCLSDKYGDLITQPSRSYDTVSVLTPTSCSVRWPRLRQLAKIDLT